MAIRAFSLSGIRSPSTSLGSEFTYDLNGTQVAAASRSNLTPVLFGSFYISYGTSSVRAFLLALSGLQLKVWIRPPARRATSQWCHRRRTRLRCLRA